jgi:alpha-tubulin suppressor-like RCC1 family protein
VTRKFTIAVLCLFNALLFAPGAQASPSTVGWGSNSHGQLGAGYTSNYTPVPVPVQLSNVKEIATADTFTVALLNDGTIRTWGENLWGELGTTQPLARKVPVPVDPGLTGVSAVAAAGAHAIVLLSNGTVMVWGSNTFGELGDGTSGKGSETCGCNGKVPQLVKGVSGATAVAAAGGYDVVLLKDGTPLAWGENQDGQLGDGTTLEKVFPTPVRGLSGVTAIAAGGIPGTSAHTLALLGNGTVVAWGANSYGQLGNGTTNASPLPVPVKGLSGIRSIAAGPYQSLALAADGSVKAWGNDFGGAPGLERCGRVFVLPCTRVPVPEPALSGVSAISAGFAFSLAISAGNVFAWGHNDLGQLGNGTILDRSLPGLVPGLSGVVGISAGQHQGLATIQGAGPPPVIQVTPGSKSLTVNWKASETGENWDVAYRIVSHPVLRRSWDNGLPPTTRSYTLSGLSPVPYEVEVKNKDFGAKVMLATPLP